VLRASPALLLVALVSAAPPPSRPDVLTGAGATAVRVADMEARCTDGSVVKLKILHASLSVNTEYGKLRIPIERIKRIEGATRIPADIRGKIEKAIEKLGDDDHDTRTKAEAELATYKVLAYPALLKKENAPDLEVRMRAQRLLKAIREYASEEELEVRYHD